MTVTIKSITSEFFSQIDSLVFVGSDDKGINAVDENFMFDSNTIIHNFARYSIYINKLNSISTLKV
jgi:hypothetical protein